MSVPALYANERIRIRPNICTLVKRKLRGPGRLLAQKNTEVSPHDVLGSFKQTLGFTKINLAQELSISPTEVPKCLQKAVGQTVFKGELIASKKGLFNKSQIFAPTDGVFQQLDEKSGNATFKLLPKEVPLAAGVFGVIQDVDHKNGEVTIKTMMTEVYGIFGTGYEKEGFISVLGEAADLINKESITDAHRGRIIVAGALILEETIKKAMSNAVSGIICGGVNLDDYLAMAGSLNPAKSTGLDVGISIIGTEGFGVIPIGEDLFELFKKYEGKYAIINGNAGRILLPSTDPNSILTCRKVGLPSYEELIKKPGITIGEIKIGSRVRLITPPFMGSQGVISEIDGNPTKMESGISTYLISVTTKNKKIRTPYSNIEIMV